ncbi:MAG: isoprenylcysteine carboxylmethyltransferase family protein [Acidobacteriota bacterium]|nr:isoprenylcysteine carboxylmethyltransferase family protein [Acidobacteriota bacterium]
MPLLLLPLLVLALPESARVEEVLGDSRSRIVGWLALAVALSGLVLRCLTVAFAPEGTSSRDTRAFRAPSLNTTGVYSLVRHPLYLGGGLMWVGVAMSLRVWWFALLVALAYWLYVERLMLVEEGFLEGQFGELFHRWAGQTPAFVPSLSGWRPATGPIQWRRVLSEHNGLLGVSFALLFLQVLDDWQFRGEPWAKWYGDHSGLIALLGFSVVVSAICIFVRRRTDGPKALPEAELL